MHIPVELQKYILTFLKPNHETSYNNMGRCVCYTKENRRCKKKVNYTRKITCGYHHYLEVPELFAYMNLKGT